MRPVKWLWLVELSCVSLVQTIDPILNKKWLPISVNGKYLRSASCLKHDHTNAGISLVTPGNIRLIGAFGHLVVFLYCSSPIPLLLLTSLWRHNGVTTASQNQPGTFGNTAPTNLFTVLLGMKPIERTNFKNNSRELNFEWWDTQSNTIATTTDRLRTGSPMSCRCQYRVCATRRGPDRRSDGHW